MSAGPFETQRQALSASLWETRGRAAGMEIYAVNVADLAAACSGIELGAHDRLVIGWLAGYEPSTVAVICGLISRPRGTAPEPGGARLAAIGAVLAEFDWETGDRQYALERIDQIATGTRTESGIEPGGGAYLTPADLVTVLAALDQAADRKRQRAAECPDCWPSPGELCDTCDRNLAHAAAYDRLAAKLGGAK